MKDDLLKKKNTIDSSLLQKVPRNSLLFYQSNNMLSSTKREFMSYCAENNVLKFNAEVPFVLKSGRASPWFFNAGNLMQHGE
jgi:hypothetical protein